MFIVYMKHETRNKKGINGLHILIHGKFSGMVHKSRFQWKKNIWNEEENKNPIPTKNFELFKEIFLKLRISFISMMITVTMWTVHDRIEWKHRNTTTTANISMKKLSKPETIDVDHHRPKKRRCKIIVNLMWLCVIFTFTLRNLSDSVSGGVSSSRIAFFLTLAFCTHFWLLMNVTRLMPQKFSACSLI